MNGKIVSDGFTFDDVLLLPGYSNFLPGDSDTRTQLTKRISIQIPVLSAPMDTVTESALAIELARQGGLGIIHKNLTAEAQAREVTKVKRSANGVIADPQVLPPDAPVSAARRLMQEQHISGVPITEGGVGHGKVVGILTRRDLKFLEDDNKSISDVMTSQNLVTGTPDTVLEQAEHVLKQNKVEKLLLVDDAGNLEGLITMRDIDKLHQFPDACRDERGRLRVGAAIGPRQLDRVDGLIEAGVDVLVIDSAHGHSQNVIDTVKTVKDSYDIDVIAGNIATTEGAQALIDAGADVIKVGIGPGSICTTRIISGVGVPQISAIMNACEAADRAGVSIIADGGIRHSGEITKAIAAGARAVMMGSLFAGLDESPGETIIHKGRRYKTYRGMGSQGAMVQGSADRYGQTSESAPQKLVPEGVEGMVPYRGSLADFVYQLVGGLRAGMGYCGTPSIDALRQDARFSRVTAASMVESHPHDISITKESSNYSIEYNDEQ